MPSDQAHKYGCLAVDQMTSEALHYAEKPETFVSDIINGGIYIFSPSVYPLIAQSSDLIFYLTKHLFFEQLE